MPEAGSAVEADTPVKSVPAWEPRANDTREKAGPPAAGKDETSRIAPGGEQALVGPGVGAEEALEASAAVTSTAWLEAESPGPGDLGTPTPLFGLPPRNLEGPSHPDPLPVSEAKHRQTR